MLKYLSDENKNVWIAVFDITKEYLSNMIGKSMVKEDSWKTGFAWFLFNIEAFIILWFMPSLL